MAMVKRGLLVVVGSLGFCFSLEAQQATSIEAKPLKTLSGNEALLLDQSAFLKTVDSSALVHGLPMLALLDGYSLPVSSEMGRMGLAQTDLFPTALPIATETETVSLSARNQTDGKDFGANGKDFNGAVPTSPSHPLYYGGEIGFLYGHQTGKYGGDLKQTYFIGTVGDDNVQITVGGSYEDSDFKYPRHGRW
jgi:hypothetical protein